MLIWILLGSLSLNVLYMKRSMEELPAGKSKLPVTAYIRGFVFGIVLGPLTIPASLLIDRWLDDDKRRVRRSKRGRR